MSLQTAFLQAGQLVNNLSSLTASEWVGTGADPQWSTVREGVASDLDKLSQWEATRISADSDISRSKWEHSKRVRDVSDVADRADHYYDIRGPMSSDRVPPSILAPIHLAEAGAWKWFANFKKGGTRIDGRYEWIEYPPTTMFAHSARHFMEAADHYQDAGISNIAIELYLEAARLAEQSSLREIELKEKAYAPIGGNDGFRPFDLLKGYLHAYLLLQDMNPRRALQTAIDYIGAFIVTGWNPEQAVYHLRRPEEKYSSGLKLRLELPLPDPIGIYNLLQNFLDGAAATFVQSGFFLNQSDPTIDTEGRRLLREAAFLTAEIDKKKEASKPGHR